MQTKENIHLMQKSHKKLWKIVPAPVCTKVALVWSNSDNTKAYLQDMYEQTHQQRHRTKADIDLMQVYAVAALCVKFDTYKEFVAAMNDVMVYQLAALLVGPPPWSSPDRIEAANLVLRPG